MCSVAFISLCDRALGSGSAARPYNLNFAICTAARAKCLQVAIDKLLRLREGSCETRARSRERSRIQYCHCGRSRIRARFIRFLVLFHRSAVMDTFSIRSLIDFEFHFLFSTLFSTLFEGRYDHGGLGARLCFLSRDVRIMHSGAASLRAV